MPTMSEQLYRFGPNHRHTWINSRCTECRGTPIGEYVYDLVLVPVTEPLLTREEAANDDDVIASVLAQFPPLMTLQEAVNHPEVRRLVFGLTPDEYYLGVQR